MVYIPGKTWNKPIFLLWVDANGRAGVHFPLPALRPCPAWTCAGPVRALGLSLCEFLRTPILLCLEYTVPLLSSIPSGSHNLSASSSSEPWGEEFDEDILSRTGWSKTFHSLYIAQLWVSVLVPTCYTRWRPLLESADALPTNREDSAGRLERWLRSQE